MEGAWQIQELLVVSFVWLRIRLEWEGEDPVHQGFFLMGGRSQPAWVLLHRRKWVGLESQAVRLNAGKEEEVEWNELQLYLKEKE